MLSDPRKVTLLIKMNEIYILLMESKETYITYLKIPVLYDGGLCFSKRLIFFGKRERAAWSQPQPAGIDKILC